jgi:LacI family transcriptional regulator
MENQKEVTIYDIARSLQVHPSTVSKALSDDPNIAKKTKKRIVEAAAQMGYRSNHLARNLRQQSSLTIGVILSDLSGGFVTTLLSGIEQVAGEAGYGIIITDSGQSAEKEAVHAQNLFHRRVDGVIVLPTAKTVSYDHFRPYIEKNIPLVFLDRAARLPQVSSVVIDNRYCGYTVTRHLIGQGCCRIVHLTPSVEQEVYAERYKGYRDALVESGLKAEDALLRLSPLSEEAVEAAATMILSMKPLPDGVFATSDLAAAVCVRIFQENNLRVPQDIAVVGFNDDVIGRLVQPQLTTVHYPGREMGETAARQMVNLLRRDVNLLPITTMTIRADLIVRASSLKKGGGAD